MYGEVEGNTRPRGSGHRLGGGGGGCCTWYHVVMQTAASSPTIRLARRPLGPKPKAIWEEWAVGEMIQGSPWLRIPFPGPHPEQRGNETSGCEIQEAKTRLWDSPSHTPPPLTTLPTAAGIPKTALGTPRP